MADHAILSASGAHRWLACTPSARFELQFPKSTSAYAEEGTLAHSVAELTTRFYLGEIDENAYEDKLAELSKSSYFNEEMLEHAESYAKFIVERLAEAKKVCADPVVILESRLDFSKYVPGGFGTGDCLIIAEPVLDVIDYKYGKSGLSLGSLRRLRAGRRRPFSAGSGRAPTSGAIRSRRFPATGAIRPTRIGRGSSSANSWQNRIPKSVKP